jgi:hypothetical protein
MPFTLLWIKFLQKIHVYHTSILGLVRSETVKLNIMLNNDFHISHGVDVIKILARFTASRKVSHTKASYNRHCAGKKDTKAKNSDHQEGLN